MRTLAAAGALHLLSWAHGEQSILGDVHFSVCVLVIAFATMAGAVLDMRSRSMVSGPAYVLAILALTVHLADSSSMYSAVYGAGVMGEIAALVAFIGLPLAIAAAPAGELMRRGWA